MSYPLRVNKRIDGLFDLVHSDVCRPCLVSSKLDFRHFITFVDDYSRVTWLYLIKKSFSLSVFQNLC